MADRDQPALARQIQELAQSGDYEGFNAIVGALTNDHEVLGVDIIRRDAEFKHRITDICREAWDRKHGGGTLEP